MKHFGATFGIGGEIAPIAPLGYAPAPESIFKITGYSWHHQKVMQAAILKELVG